MIRRFCTSPKGCAHAVDNPSMDYSTTNPPGDTVRIRRPARVTTDELGHNVWMGGVDPLLLDLDADVATDPYNSTATDLPLLTD